MSKRHRVVAVGLLLTASVGGAIFAVIQWRLLIDLPSDAYASDWTAVFVIEHLESTDDSWPRDWEDLRDEFDRMAEPSHYAWTFEELQDRVDLRFDVTAEQVRDAQSPVTVFGLTSGRKASYDGDPNLLIRHYLQTGEGGMESLRDTD